MSLVSIRLYYTAQARGVSPRSNKKHQPLDSLPTAGPELRFCLWKFSGPFVFHICREHKGREAQSWLGMHSPARSSVITHEVLAFAKRHDPIEGFCVMKAMGPRKCPEKNRARKHSGQGSRAGTKGLASLSKRFAEREQAERDEPNADAAAALVQIRHPPNELPIPHTVLVPVKHSVAHRSHSSTRRRDWRSSFPSQSKSPLPCRSLETATGRAGGGACTGRCSRAARIADPAAAVVPTGDGYCNPSSHRAVLQQSGAATAQRRFHNPARIRAWGCCC